ncbi:uncharacterized protein PFL1_06591 [Pseudozyma flocculosa PF-1]|uniref:Related to SKT5 - protoplast regeneration and killer toxin resistance protein n=2 Tax=Pseudozyma flocculosa TaxID=84751 RepID=A0A5C3FAW1_9BASI|nr:uncharacterized protein PFL1_06591 [Pseudozyma flocculosa PF-1]EPQ25917.1 hypothetical protein PFL1_06591 [Pseudozyma flocculosa PF-1]SPO40581.1 related to SKT5 - protoplast regeneration and killer toxin resistance protein [Pseudozyma flocculosa]
MASPISPAQAYHNRFNIAGAAGAANSSAAHDSAAAAAAAAAPSLPRASSDNYSYPDLDAGQYHSSSAADTSATLASAPLNAGPLPSFPEFSSFDVESDFSASRDKDDFFDRFAARNHPPTAAPALSSQPASTSQQQQQQQPDRVTGGDGEGANNDGSRRQGDPSGNAVGTEAEAGAGPEADPHQSPLAQLASQAHLERGFSSASMYQSPPASSSTGAALPPLPTKSDQRSAASGPGRSSIAVDRPSVDVQSVHSSHQQHSASNHSATSPISASASNQQQQQQQQHHHHQHPASPQKGALTSNFTFPSAPAQGGSADSAGHSSVDSLPFNDLALGHRQQQYNQQQQQRQQQQQTPQQQQQLHQHQAQPQHFVERERPSSFFGMERPLAAVNASGQHVPVPRGMIPGDDDNDEQQRLQQSHSGAVAAAATSPISMPIPPQMRQPAPGAAANGPRPSSFFGVEGAPPGTATPPALPDDDQAARGQHPSSHRSEGSYRGISTAAGGTGNGPMPSSASGNGYGGLGASGATRPASIAPTINSGPLLDHSHLKPGQKASLLSHGKTLELYRQNAKKTNDPNLIYELAVFMIDASKTMGDDAPGSPPTNGGGDDGPNSAAKKDELVKEATGLLKKIADRGHPDAQYFLADCYANGIGTAKGKQDFGQAYTYFVLAAKHGHPDAAYRAGTCYEKGWGCRKDNAKALQFYRKASSQNHPGAMYRLATAELNGELGLKKSAKEGVKWLKRSAEAATPEFPHALHELALLHERGIDNVLFVDPEYSCELLAQAGEMGYAPSAYKLGVNYEYGRMGCPQDGGLSIHMYNIAAQQNHKEACFALTAWYLVGAPGILPQSDTEAYLWAKKAAEQGLAKAEYAVGYFTEMGIGTVKDVAEAKAWYRSAAEHGDKRANQRLAALGGRPEKSLAGVGAGGGGGGGGNGGANNGRGAAGAMSTDYGKRGQPTSAPFPGSVDRSSMAPSTQMSYPSPIAMRDAQTAQREQQYLANVAATERAQAQAQAQARNATSPMRSGPPSAVASPVAEPGRPFSQGQAYPSYPATASASMPLPPPQLSTTDGGGGGDPNRLLSPQGAGAGPMSPLSPTSPNDGEDGKKKKKWFGRS